MTEISAQACVDPKAQIGAGCSIGPFCVVGPDVVLGDHCHLLNNVTLAGATRVGAHNVFYPGCVIGAAPQDLKYQGAPTQTLIGDHNVFREFTTVHRGTELGGGKTVIGSWCLFMVGAHIAHDCVVEDSVIIGNQTQLAGHVRIEHHAVVTALIGLHHFVTVGCYSYIGGLTPVRRDVPPFVKFSGDPNEVRGLNEEGLRRHGFSLADIEQLNAAYRLLFRSEKGRNMAAGLDQLEAQPDLNPHVRYLCSFLRASLQNRFGRYQESFRQDTAENRRQRVPLEIRENPH